MTLFYFPQIVNRHFCFAENTHSFIGVDSGLHPLRANWSKLLHCGPILGLKREREGRERETGKMGRRKGEADSEGRCGSRESESREERERGRDGEESPRPRWEPSMSATQGTPVTISRSPHAKNRLAKSGELLAYPATVAKGLPPPWILPSGSKWKILRIVCFGENSIGTIGNRHTGSTEQCFGVFHLVVLVL